MATDPAKPAPDTTSDLAERVVQQGRALDLAAHCRLRASEYAQLGFEALAAECRKSARAFERYAVGATSGCGH